MNKINRLFNILNNSIKKKVPLKSLTETINRFNIDNEYENFVEENKIRLARGIPVVRLDQDFLKVLRNIDVEQYSGAALGVERLLAVLARANKFSELEIY